MSFVKKCQWCGKEFTTKRYPTKFCGLSCYNKHKRAEKNKRKLELIKRYDSHINVVIDDGKLRYIKQCDHCGMEFRACRPDGRFCCTKCHDAHDRKISKSKVSHYVGCFKDVLAEAYRDGYLLDNLSLKL